ncbi:Synaptojanin-2-binding protein [Exaiptasia diaphana]|nr:Synaptojanin-2-binding protein [Exaiptasia diaphana]
MHHDLYFHQADDESSLHGDSSPTDGQLLKIELSLKAGGLGFNIQGGRDKPVRQGDPSIYISRLRTGATAQRDGRLHPGDRILQINGTDTRDVTHAEALNLFRQNQKTISLLVEPNAIAPSELSSKEKEDEVQRIELRKDKKEHLNSGVYVMFKVRQ